MTPHPKIFLKAYLQGTNTLVGSGGNLEVLDAALLQVSEGDFTKIGANAAVKVYRTVSLDLLYEKTVAGKNVGAGSSLGIGLSYIHTN